MDIIRINTLPSFEIVPRYYLNLLSTFKITLTNEFSKEAQDINCSVSLLENENYQLVLSSFPIGKNGDKLSYIIIDISTNETISLGKIMIVLENENIQDYSNKNINNIYN